MVYAGANAELKVGARFEGNCAGPMDVKAWPLVLDPAANIEHHVAEAALGWRKGHRGLGLCRYVMVPSAPRDWGGGRFLRTHQRHLSVIENAYRDGSL